METIPFEEVQDRSLGKVGTPRRDAFEAELEKELLIFKIKEERKRLHITQEELGNRLGVKKSYISSIENYKRKTTLDTLFKIAYALGFKFDLAPLRND